MQNNSGRYTLILFLVSFIMLAMNLGVLPANIMEARNFITAREMVQDGHWILTTLNGEARYEKPPLPTWMTAAIGAIFGFKSILILRFAVVFITQLLVVYIYKLSVKIGFSARASFHNGLILITSFYIYFAGRDNQWDMYCHSFMIVSIYYLWNILNRKENPIKNAVIGGLFLAFSILSKGPISLYALLLPFLIAYGWIYKFKFKNEKRHLAASIIYVGIGVIIGASWSVYIHWIDPESLAKMAKVETSRWINDYNSKSVFYYWIFFTQSGIWTIPALLALIYPYMKNKVSNLRLYKFTLIWTLTSLVLLSIIPEKKMRYILPTLIPLALNIGFYIEYVITGTKTKLDKILATMSFGLIGLIGILYPFILFLGLKDKIFGQINWMIASSIALFIAGVIIINYLRKDNFIKTFYSLIVLQCLIIALVFPLSKSLLYNPNYKPAKSLLRFTQDKMVLYDYKYMTPEIVWDYGAKIPPIDESGIEKQLVKFNKNYVGILCLDREMNTLKKELKGKYNIREVSHVDLNAVAPGNNDYRERLARHFLIIFKQHHPKKIN